MIEYIYVNAEVDSLNNLIVFYNTAHLTMLPESFREFIEDIYAFGDEVYNIDAITIKVDIAW